MPLFSIIIPTYNAANVIGNSIASVLEQTFKEVEICVIDAASTDETMSIVQRFDDPRIRIVSEPDKGIYDAMNKGIRMSKGTWIYLMGSDDRLYNPTVLTTIASEIQKEQPLHVLYANVWNERFNEKYNGVYYDEKLFHDNICHQSIFFHRSVFDTTGLFDLKYKAHADWDHNIKWFFAPQIKKKYSDAIIAYYAAGGFSAQHGDPLFAADKIFNYLKYGYRLSRKSTRHQLWKMELDKAKNQNDMKRVCKLLWYYRYVLPRCQQNVVH